MNSKRSPREVFLALVHGLCEGRLDEVVSLYAEKTDVSHPFDPMRGQGFMSQAQLAEHFAKRPPSNTITAEPSNTRIHETQDPEVIVAEFAYAGENLETKTPFSYACICVMRVRDGQIVESRDYVDHLSSAEARGMLAPFLAQITKRRADAEAAPSVI